MQSNTSEAETGRLYEFKVTLDYIMSFRSLWDAQWEPVSRKPKLTTERFMSHTCDVLDYSELPSHSPCGTLPGCQSAQPTMQFQLCLLILPCWQKGCHTSNMPFCYVDLFNMIMKQAGTVMWADQIPWTGLYGKNLKVALRSCSLDSGSWGNISEKP